jgi:hypothetical protein
MTSLRAGVVRSAASRHGAPGTLWWVALFGLLAVLLMPLLVVDVPPLMDYPNHLARAFVLASLPGDAVLARFYVPHWSIIPNLAFDLIAPPLIHALPVHVAGRLLIAASVLLPTLGAIAYNTALGGRWWSLAAGLVAYNNCLLYGFLNFEIGLGLGLLLAAAWLRWRERRPLTTIILAMLGTPVLFACHLMGLVFFGLLAGSTELFQLWQLSRGDLPRVAVRRGAVLVLVFAAPSALYAVSALEQLGGDAEFAWPLTKAIGLMAAFSSYNAVLDAMAAAFAVCLIAGSVIAGRGRIPEPAAIAIGLLAVIYAVAPSAWKGTYSLDTRFAIMLAFMLFAGFVPNRWPPGFRTLAAGGLMFVFLARMALLTTVWADHRVDLADLRRVLTPVQPGQAVYVAEAGRDEAPAYWKTNPGWRFLAPGMRVDDNVGALILIEHRAYWPFEFDVSSQQPIETKEPYRSLAVRVGAMPNRTEAALADVCGFDHVLLMEADAVPSLPTDRFRLEVSSGFAALYAIIRCKD